jgi:hypothetical protein
MPSFFVGQTHVTSTPLLGVDPIAQPGRYRFRLEVEDQSGNVSAPAEVVVTVFRPAPPPPPPVTRPPITRQPIEIEDRIGRIPIFKSPLGRVVEP